MTSTLFITGATSGFGKACARRFAEAGWSLVLTGRREERLNALCAELSGQTEVHGLVLDVRDRKAMEEAIANLPPWPWASTRHPSVIWTTGTPWSIPTSKA